MLGALPLLVLAAVPVDASTAQTLLNSSRELQADRWADVDNYTVTVSVEASGGLETPLYYEKMEVDGQITFRMVSLVEYNRRLLEQAGYPADPAGMAGAGTGLSMLADVLAAGSPDMPPLDMGGLEDQMSAFTNASATYTESDGRAEAAADLNDFNRFAARAKLKGTETVQANSGAQGGTALAYKLVADGLSDVQVKQPPGDTKYSMVRVSLWLEKDQLVPLRLLMDLEAEAKGKKSSLTIEKFDLNYKQVGPLYESHRQEYRISGLMSNLSDKERKEMEKARADYEKAKAQLASMPPDQRAMVEKMMKGQMDKFEAMMAGDAVSTATDVVSIAINEGPPTAAGPGDLIVGGPAGAAYPGALTIAAENPVAELAIAAQDPDLSLAIIGLIGIGAFPEPGKTGQVEIGGAGGDVKLLFPDTVKVSIEKGTGVITVTERTQTRIAGTFTALLTGRSSKEPDPKKTVDFEASGSFDTGAPAGPLKTFRGCPIPADLFQKP